jgi:hypothetical protein
MEQLNNKIHREAEDPEQMKREIEKEAARRAITRAKVNSWDLNIALFLFLVLTVVIILLFHGLGIEIVASIAIFGLACVWLVGWRQRRILYRSYYEQELINLMRESSIKAKDKMTVQQKIEETVEEHIKRAFAERRDKERALH